MYRVHILSNDEFDSIPATVTRGSDVSSSLGFADPSTGNAYVRYTASDELNKYLVNHEFEELASENSVHEDGNGIRHKKFFKEVWAPVTAALTSFVDPVSPGGKSLATGISEKQKKKKAQQQGTGTQQVSALSRFSPSPSTAPSPVPGASGGGSVVGRLGGGGTVAQAPRKTPRQSGFFGGRIPF